ncbi:replication factor C subunit 1 isoform X2 [Ostrinia furnacalis]|uniref:replication factor C subunit 1 isoform X1 n=1 Tax=Ostrinia furnacalis TaxID=93504 RepID=UPI00103BD870|nr:replication factor C subunit 1 isoform X1 [Ostrinia furnacalis]XP_028157702.1 replication factor C subunit 1 isoform X2 [Ostrinia furnacalis]
MSRDIRSFFQPKKAPKAKVEELDDDVIPESPEVQIKNKKKESRKKRVLSDSEEEIFDSKKKKPINDPKKKSPSKTKTKSPKKPVLKEVKAVDIFGSAPIKRTEPIVKKSEKKEKKNTETGIHSDDDFDKSLLELDEIEESALKLEEPTTSKAPDEHEKSDQKIEQSPLKIKEKQLDKTEIKKEKSPFKIKDKQPEKNDIKKEKSPFKINDNDIQDKNGSKKFKNEPKSNISKMNDKKRKFAEFLENENETNHDSGKSNVDAAVKKKKLNDSVTDDKRNGSKEVKVKKEDSNDLHDNDATIIEDEINESRHESTKKKKFNKSLNESVLTDEERHERKIHSAQLYQKYLNRSGPKHLGAKEIPEGAPDCLKNCAFLLTGVLDSFEREEVTDAITKYGGCIKSGISKKVTHVLAGEEAGPAKMAKAQELGIKIINEDEFIQMIRDSTNKHSKEKDTKKEKSPSRKSSKDKKESKEINGVNKNMNDTNKTKTSHRKDEDKSKHEKTNGSESKENKSKIPKKVETEIKKENEVKKEKKIELDKPKTTDLASAGKSDSSKSVTSSIDMMWVDKYKPQNLKQIIGQHGDASNVKKLTNWLTKWYVNRKAKLPKPSPWAKNDDGGYFKAALLSGPPGVGKTTTVALVCKELGFDVVEFNASDTRSKTLIKEQITELLNTTSLSGYSKGDTGKQAVTKKHVLVMDEVDGMAGNEDRGGLQELIGLIKATSVPIICMCNDRNSQKMRSLVNYCYDLRFTRPRVDQIKSAMMSICFKEGLKIPPDALSQLIVAANQDVRQTLHLLSMWAADPDADPDKLRKDATSVRKDVKLGPWEAIRKVFSAEDHKTMSINDKSDLFFYDYSLAPLFVYENYLQVAPHCPKNEILDRVSRAADSISLGDLVDARIRRSQAWGLLPMQAMYSSVIPGHWLSGHVAGQIQFPGWLGKNSRANKMQRLCQEIHAHTRLSTSGSKSSIFLDYSSHLRDAIVTPLIKDRSEGIGEALGVLEAYHLLRDDLDSLTELSLWPGQRNPMVLVDSKVKAAMTRTYNKSATALPYAPGTIKKGRGRDDNDNEDEVDDDAAQDEEEDSDPENDALIKKKKAKEDKPASKDKPSSSKEKPSTSKSKASSSKEKKKK